MWFALLGVARLAVVTICRQSIARECCSVGSSSRAASSRRCMGWLCFHAEASENGRHEWVKSKLTPRLQVAAALTSFLMAQMSSTTGTANTVNLNPTFSGFASATAGFYAVLPLSVVALLSRGGQRYCSRSLGRRKAQTHAPVGPLKQCVPLNPKQVRQKVSKKRLNHHHVSWPGVRWRPQADQPQEAREGRHSNAPPLDAKQSCHGHVRVSAHQRVLNRRKEESSR